MKSIGPIMIALKTMFFIALMCFIPSMAKAQKKQKARIKLEYHNIDGVKILKAKVVSKVGRVYVAVPDVPVHFFINEEIEENKLSQAITDKEGMVKITLDATLIMSADSTYIFYASIMDNPVYKDKSKDIEIKDVNYSLECAVIDSVKIATINIKDLENKPVADVMVKLYVKRLFGLLPIGDDY